MSLARQAPGSQGWEGQREGERAGLRHELAALSCTYFLPGERGCGPGARSLLRHTQAHAPSTYQAWPDPPETVEAGGCWKGLSWVEELPEGGRCETRKQVTKRM